MLYFSESKLSTINSKELTFLREVITVSCSLDFATSTSSIKLVIDSFRSIIIVVLITLVSVT